MNESALVRRTLMRAQQLLPELDVAEALRAIEVLRELELADRRRVRRSRPERPAQAPFRQGRAILEFLRTRGPEGATADELCGLALKYTGRISELRQAGYEIEVRVGEGGHRYVLTGDPSPTPGVEADGQARLFSMPTPARAS